MAEMLELKNVTKTFNPGTVNEKIALKNLNLLLIDDAQCDCRRLEAG